MLLNRLLFLIAFRKCYAFRSQHHPITKLSNLDSFGETKSIARYSPYAKLFAQTPFTIATIIKQPLEWETTQETCKVLPPGYFYSADCLQWGKSAWTKTKLVMITWFNHLHKGHNSGTPRTDFAKDMSSCTSTLYS